MSPALPYLAWAIPLVLLAVLVVAHGRRARRLALEADILETLRTYGPLQCREVAGLCRTLVTFPAVRDRLASLEERGLVVSVAVLGGPGPELQWHLVERRCGRWAP